MNDANGMAISVGDRVAAPTIWPGAVATVIHVDLDDNHGQVCIRWDEDSRPEFVDPEDLELL
jgi:hypothetical protein